MSAYYLWAKQHSQGCDYTIGCGERLIPLPISSLEEMGPAVYEALENRGIQPGSENAAQKLLILKCVEELDPDEWDYTDDREEEEDEGTAARRRQYEELKREFG